MLSQSTRGHGAELGPGATQGRKKKYWMRSGGSFFPQTATSPDWKIYKPQEFKNTESKVDISPQGMEAAIEWCNERSAAVPDSITNSLRKNLTEAVKRRKLKLINDAWYEGNNPGGSRLSWVCPIPKPGKNPVCASNVRSILLTFIRCKLMERMVLSRIDWIVQQRREVLHSAQMGCHKSPGPQATWP